MNKQLMQASLEAGISSCRVPGAALGLLRDGGFTVVSAGVLNLDTQVAVTNDSMFQIGSITKVLTATLIMKLADLGKLELDRPVSRYLPDFRLADGAGTDSITPRHLLTHTSGIDGDFFIDTGRGDDVLERYVERCATLEAIHPAGEAFSYCNTGYVIAGRLVEVLTGLSWDQVVREWLFDPLDMRDTATLPEHLVGRLAAMGHLPSKQDRTVFEPLANAYPIPFSIGPAGATATMSARDLLRFTQMHINEGRTGNAKKILSPQSVRSMQEPVITVPGIVSMCEESWGLGWSVNDWDGQAVIGHDGNTGGQRASLRALPDQGVALALLTNGGAGIDLAHEMINKIFATAAGLSPLPGVVAETALPRDLSPYTGRYGHTPGFTDVYEQDRQLMMRSIEAPGCEPETFKLEAVGNALFSSRRPPDNTPWYVKFLDFNDGHKAGCMFSLYRRCPRKPHE